MPGHIKSIDDYQVVEGTDIVYLLEGLGSINNIRDAYAQTLMNKAHWPTEQPDRTETGRILRGWNFYRASKGGNVWEDIETGDAVLIGSFEADKTPPTLDVNENILLKSFGYHLKSEGKNGNVLLNKDGRKIADLEGFGVIHHDVDGYGNYYAEIFKTRSSGGRPVTDKHNYAFLTPNGERIGGRDKSFERTEGPSIKSVKSKYTVAGVSPYYIYDMGKNNAGRPEIYPNLAEMLISSMNSPTPFIKTPTQYLNPLFDRQAQVSSKIGKLQAKLGKDSTDQEIITQLTDELEAIDIALRMFERAISRGEMAIETEYEDDDVM